MEPKTAETEKDKRPETGEAGAEAGGEKGGRQWSNPLPLKEAMQRAPVLVQLEDGSRGAVESLSFSIGDVMALEGEIRVKDRRLVLAHFTTEMEGADGETDEQAIYRSLLSIPWEHLPEVDVRVCEDSGGVAYSNFVTTHFPQCNWRQQQKELLDDMDEDDYDDIREITPPQTRPPPAPRRDSKKRRPPPPPPCEPPSPSTPHRPPPRPPKLSPADDCRKDTRTPDKSGKKPPPPLPPRITELSQAPDATSKPEALFPSELAEDELNTAIYDYDNSYIEILDDVDDGDNPEGTYVDIKKQEEQLKLKRELQREKEKEEKKDSTRKSVKKDPKKDTFPRKQGQTAGLRQEDAVVTSASFKPIVRVQPLASVLTSPSERPPMTSPVELSSKGDSNEDEEECFYELPKDSGMVVSNMTCRQLCARLKLCGMPELASICEAQHLDGPFFFSVPDDQLKKSPFSLSDFDINFKLKQVKSGWVPT